MAEEKNSSIPEAAQGQTSGRPAATLPPLSAIPGLGRADPEPHKPMPAYIKETDSPYVRLSKLRGHKDLLKMDLPETREKQKPVSYTRNDWFYHLDNAKEDALKKPTTNSRPGKYVLPGITPAPSGLRRSSSSGGVEIPTYGLRKVVPEKPLFTIPPKRYRNKPANPWVYGTMAAEEGSGRMDKLLSNSYQQEWQDQSRDHRAKLQSQITKSKEPCSMYNCNFGPAVMFWQRGMEYLKQHDVKSRYLQPAKKPVRKLGPLSVPDGKKGAVDGKKQGKPFKLSRFKKVGPKVNTGEKKPI